ncbi:hypothetical protein [Streptomonospora salina]|uniref:Uncharacterized protein n=1 Tax=Streptomonospora salina TaxID=104205 RepID=A0A841E6C8_9ACTN|nr:hypothetical protein [Streptomonospora salina]MBB5998352.1 hypothetical protein [Streptomonospora salina]
MAVILAVFGAAGHPRRLVDRRFGAGGGQVRAIYDGTVQLAAIRLRSTAQEVRFAKDASFSRDCTRNSRVPWPTRTG